MRAIIKHDIKGRMRVHFEGHSFTLNEADTLQYYLETKEGIDKAVVYERTKDAVINYSMSREELIDVIRVYNPDDVKVPDSYFESSSRETNSAYYDKIVTSIISHYSIRLFIPFPVRIVLTCIKAVRYVYRGLKTIMSRELKVEMLDAIAIIAAIVTKDYTTASSVMFLLDIGDILEEWTHKRCVDDVARQMSLNVTNVWKETGDIEVLTDANLIEEGDIIVVRVGNIIPFDGIVISGDGMVNQASMTGEAIPVRKTKDAVVYAGTVLEEGEIKIRVTAVGGCGRFDKIVKMIEESEKLKSSLESKANRLADKLVPYTLGGAIITYFISRNVNKAVSVLMVDYSCALKLAMPISVLSAIREAADLGITVKGGRFLEAVSDADVVVFDKTGTLTKAEPVVKNIISFNGEKKRQLLKEAACLEEHFPHSIANAVVKAAAERNITHDELHTDVEYVVAHGISTKINGVRALIGSYHFIFEDEHVAIEPDKKKEFDELSDEYSHLYYAKDGKLAAVILIEDPLREDAADTVLALKESGISKVVMMTGDSEKTAKRIASRVGVDEYYSEVLPEDKAGFVEGKKKEGLKVVMIGDGINDSPALSAADAGIAISEGADIARQIADITISSDDLKSVVKLKKLSDLLMKRIKSNYISIVGFNSALIILGLIGIITPSTSALLHNTSTIASGLRSTTGLMDTKDHENV